jgi:hypothetical protein
MAEPKGGAKPFVWVKDKAGNEYLCPLESLKDPKDATKEELDNCFDDAQMGVNIGD